MSVNKYGETELEHIVTSSQAEYFISRDLAGNHVLRKGSTNGKELFSKVRDNGKKNTKTGRIIDVELLRAVIENIEPEE